MDEKYLSAPVRIADYYKLFSHACIESIRNHYGCDGLTEIVMPQGHIDVYYNDSWFIEVYCAKNYSQ